MKYKHGNGMGSIPQETCGPTVKDLQEQLVELKQVQNSLHEMEEAGYISYNIIDSLFGNIYFRIRVAREQIKSAKKRAKNAKTNK